MLGNNKIKIKFIKGGFTSPALGNVWEGRKATLARKTGQAFINNGQAVLDGPEDIDNIPPDDDEDESGDKKKAADDSREESDEDKQTGFVKAPARKAGKRGNRKSKRS